MSRMPRTETIPLRVAEPLREVIERLAAADSRTMADYVRLVLVKHAAERIGEIDERAA